MVVHGDGLDEITIAGESEIAEIKDGAVIRYTIKPEDVGLSSASLSGLLVSSVEESEAIFLAVLEGEKGAARDIVLLNAAAALLVADWAKDFPDAVSQAAAAIDQGTAKEKLNAFLRHVKSDRE